MLNEEINDFFSEPSEKPIWLRSLVILFSIIIILALSYHFIINDEIIKLEKLTQKEPLLKKEFSKKVKQEKQLTAYINQFKILKKRFPNFINRIPKKINLAEIISHITQITKKSNIELTRLEPKLENIKTLYVKQDILIELNGSYNQFALFIQAITNIPRIITIHNIHLIKSQQSHLKMTAILRTYRYKNIQDDKEE